MCLCAVDLDARRIVQRKAQPNVHPIDTEGEGRSMVHAPKSKPLIMESMFRMARPPHTVTDRTRTHTCRRGWGVGVRFSGGSAALYCFTPVSERNLPDLAFVLLFYAAQSWQARCVSIWHMILQKRMVCVLYGFPRAPLRTPWLGELEGTSLAIAYCRPTKCPPVLAL